jgi:hypothetical protein
VYCGERPVAGECFAHSYEIDLATRVATRQLNWIRGVLDYLRKRLAESGQSIPNQVGKPSINPPMRWVFQFFEGIDILHVRSSTGYGRHVLHLNAVHEQVLCLLGPPYQELYDVPI